MRLGLYRRFRGSWLVATLAILIAIALLMLWFPPIKKTQTMASIKEENVLEVPEELAFQFSQGPFSLITFSPDGRYMVFSGADRSIYIGELSSEKIIRVLGAHADLVNSICYSADGKRFFSAGSDGYVRTWDVEKWEELRTFGIQYSSTIYHMVAHPSRDEIVFAGVHDDYVVLEEMPPQRLGHPVESRRFPGHGRMVTALAFSPDGSLLATGDLDNNVRLWDYFSGNVLKQFHYGAFIESVTFSPDGKFLASADAHNYLHICQTDTGAEVYPPQPITCGARHLLFSADGHYLFAASVARDQVPGINFPRGVIRVFHLGQQLEMVTFLAHNEGGQVSALTLSPDGRRLASAASTYGEIRVWKISEILKLFKPEVGNR
jgi:WD40 repeat protein